MPATGTPGVAARVAVGGLRFSTHKTHDYTDAYRILANDWVPGAADFCDNMGWWSSSVSPRH